MVMVTIDNNKTGAMWIRAIFRYYCKAYDCTVIKVTRNTYAAEGTEENRRTAEWKFDFAMSALLIAQINARAENPHRDSQTVTLETTRNFAKELWGV